MLARLYKFNLFVFAIILCFNVQKSFARKTCRITRGATEMCVPINTCKPMATLINNEPQPYSAFVKFIVKNAHCGTFNNVHHVCCDTNQIDNGQDDEQQQQTTTTQAPQQAIQIRKGSDGSDSEIAAGMEILRNNRRCGKTDADRVSNGENATLFQYPFMALLIYSDGIQEIQGCGGSLISDRYVLTAAHCVRVRNKLVSVLLGELDTSQPIDCNSELGEKRKCAPRPQQIEVEEIIYHQNYQPNPRFLNDIALIRLVTPAEISSSVKPICLPITEKSRNNNLNEMIIAGWGKTENDNPATILQYGIVPLRDNSYCDEKFKFITLSDSQFCAGGGSRKVDTCIGDSGGPIFNAVQFNRKLPRFVQFGIVSGGSYTCGLEFPSIFTRIEKFLDWIAGNLRN